MTDRDFIPHSFQSDGTMTPSKNAFLGMCIICSALFWANPRDSFTKGTFPLSENNETALLVGRLYLQVIACLFLMLFFVSFSPKYGQGLSILTLLITMTKHTVMDKVTPPPLMIMGTVLVGFLTLVDFKTQQSPSQKTIVEEDAPIESSAETPVFKTKARVGSSSSKQKDH